MGTPTTCGLSERRLDLLAIIIEGGINSSSLLTIAQNHIIYSNVSVQTGLSSGTTTQICTTMQAHYYSVLLFK